MNILRKPEPTLPMPPAPIDPQVLRGGVPARRAMSEAAAAAAQHVCDLEAEIAMYKAELDTWKARALAAEAESTRMKDKIEHLEEQRDLFKERVWNMEARLDDVAAVVMRMVDTKMLPHKPNERDTMSTKVAKAKGQDAIEKEIAEKTKPPEQS